MNLGAPGVGTDPIKLASRPFSHCGTQQLSEIKSAANPTIRHLNTSSYSEKGKLNELNISDAGTLFCPRPQTE